MMKKFTQTILIPFIVHMLAFIRMLIRAFIVSITAGQKAYKDIQLKEELACAFLVILIPVLIQSRSSDTKVGLGYFPIKTYYVFTKFKAEDSKDERTVAYIKRFHKTAMEEDRLYNVSASVTLAQGIIESNSGASKLAKEHNNHFGIKCFSRTCRKGHCVNYGDDTHKDFFRKFNTAWESYRVHTEFLQKPNYVKCIGKSYKEYCKCLKKGGYATSKTYAEDLIRIIEKYKLYEFEVK